MLKLERECSWVLRNTQWLHALAALTVVGAVALAPVQAQTTSGQNNTSTAAGTGQATLSVSRNVYAAGGAVRPASAIEGDLVAAGGRVVVDHAVKDDAVLTGGSIDLRAAVGDDVRAAGGDISIESTIGGELVAAGGSIKLARTAHVAGRVSLAGGSVAIDGKVDGPLQVRARSVVINGEVGGDVRLYAQQIDLGPQAKIKGALRYSSANELRKSESASIDGVVTRQTDHMDPMPGHRDDWHGWSGGPRGPGWAGSVFGYLAMLACAAIVMLIFPRFSARAADAIPGSPWLALAVGFGTLAGAPLLAVLLFITLLGIPLGIVVLALYPALLLVGYVVAVLFVARRAQAALRKESAESVAAQIGFFALALVLVMLVAMVPFVGALTLAALTVAGVGACVLELLAHRKTTGSAGPTGSATGTPAGALGT